MQYLYSKFEFRESSSHKLWNTYAKVKYKAQEKFHTILEFPERFAYIYECVIRHTYCIVNLFQLLNPARNEESQ